MRLAFTVAALLLAGCASPQQRQMADISQAHTMCAAAGYQEGTQAMADCTITTARHASADRAAKVQAFGDAMTRWSQQLQQQQQQNTPHVTNCQQFGNQIQCVTQ